jgi:pre-rRNA-processing protein IPI3
MWSLHAPFNLLATFTFPPSVLPSLISVDPSERFFYVATTSGDVYHVPLFQRRAELGARGDVEAVGGGGQGAPPVKVTGRVISLK